MATRIRMMKLLQETQGLAEVTNRRPPTRSTAALVLQIRQPLFRRPKDKQKRIIRIVIQDPPDIPHPVKIRHLTGSELPVVLVRQK